MSNDYVHEKYDIGITRTSTAKVGLMLVKDKNGNPRYQVLRDPYLAAQFFTGTPGYGNLPSEKELAIRQDDWRSGFGLDVDDGTKRYYSSDGMDLRFRGKAIAGQTPTIHAFPVATTVPTIINGTLEAQTGWTYDTDWTRSSTQKQAGSYSIRFNKAVVATTYNHQYLVGWTPGVQYTVTVYCYGYDASNTASIRISDGTQDVDSTTNATQAWVAKTAQITVASTATYLRISFKAVTASAENLYWDTVSITMDSAAGAVAYSGVTRAFAEFEDDLWYTLDKKLIQMDGATGASLLVWQCGANITDLEPYSDDRLYIAQGLAAAYLYMPVAATFALGGITTSSGKAAENFKYFAFVHTTADTMYGSDAVNKMRSCTTPVNGGANDWTGQTTVGSSYYEITKLLEKSGALYMMKEDMPYYLDSAGAVQNDLAPELATETKSTDNGKNAIIWKNRLYMPWGDQVLLEYDAGTNTYRSPSDYCTDLSAFNGQVFAIAGDGRYLHAITNNGADVEVLAGRLETIESTTDWVWHPIAGITLDGCETAFVSSVYQKRLWISSTLSTNSLYYIPLPTGYGDIINDANRLFKTGTTCETPWLHGNFRATNKEFIDLTLEMEHTYNVGRYFTVRYKLLGGSWVSISGNFDGSATSMIETKFLAGASTSRTSTMIKLEFTAVTDDTDYTPQLLSYHLKGILRPSQREIIICEVRCANEIQIKQPGVIDQGSHDEIVATLDEAMLATWPVTIYDINGDAKTVNFLPTNPYWVSVKDEMHRELERHYTLVMQAVTLA